MPELGPLRRFTPFPSPPSMVKRFLIVLTIFCSLSTAASFAASSSSSASPVHLTAREKSLARRKERLAARLARQVKASSSSSSLTSSVSAPVYARCTPDTWICVTRGYCTNGMIDNYCQRRLGSNLGEMLQGACLNPEAVKPPSKVPCGSSSSSSSISILDRMKANMDAWTEARKELTAKMTTMGNQPSGAGCMPTLAAIDSDWVMNYNNYLSAYNNMGYGSGDWSGAIQTAERQMADVIQRIHGAPTFCY